jgi:hypothetical protein
VGRSLIPLNGPWKFHVGDSPMAAGTNAPLWATPGFDDSQWETVDLTPLKGAFDPVAGYSGYVPGWTAKGHPGYWGYAWYRIRVRLQSKPGVNLAVEGPSDVDDAYQLFANGALLGSFGHFEADHAPVLYNTRPEFFTMPRADGTEVLAFRFWMAPQTVVIQPDVGGLHTPPLVGEASAVQAQYQLDWLQAVRAYMNAPVLAAVSFGMAIVAFCLYLLDRGDAVYVWLGSVCLARCIDAVCLALFAWTEVMGSTADSVEAGIGAPLLLGGWLIVWWTWFRLQRPAWIPRLIGGLTLVYLVCSLLGQDLFITVMPHAVSMQFHTGSVVVRLAMLALLAYIVYRGIREKGREGWLALPAVLLMCMATFQVELGVLHIRTVWFPMGVQVTAGTIAYLLLILTMMVLLLRRLTLSLRHQRAMAAEMKHAQEVQHVLLPEPVNVPWLQIKSEYLPAREVGGDFFQIVPHATDGSVLVVAGDVEGKGLQAGMLVALLVGAIRSTAELNSDPRFVLEALNRRLLGRNDARATCLALRMERDGTVTLANAGHLPPYVNGAEVPMEGSLPLGTMAGAEFPVSQFRLEEHDTLTLISDGIPEAQDKERRLFGFDRVREMLHSRISPHALAAAAQAFGQEDDISVVSVQRV